MKIDCSITQNFMKEFARMCKYMPNCGKCDMNLIGEYGSVCYEDCMSTLQCERYMTDIQEIVQDWSDEHPPKLTIQEAMSDLSDENAVTHGHIRKSLLLALEEIEKLKEKI